MAPRQSITSLALQVSNSAKKRQGPVSQRRAEETPQSGRPVQGTLRFIDQSSSSRHSASDPIEIEDDSQPVQGTASSWEKDQYYFGEHDPYDETFKPPERDSQDETMVFDTSKTRQQPPRLATTRKRAHVIPNAMFEEDHGILTPPPTNLRQMRKGTVKENSKGKEKETLATSDPVETPVPGPSRQQSHSRTPLTSRNSELYVDVPNIAPKQSSTRAIQASTSNENASASTRAGEGGREKNWLSKRTAQSSTSSKSNGIQTKMTRFIIDKAPNTVAIRREQQNRGLDCASPERSVERDDVFEESVQFVSMSKPRNWVVANTSDEQIASGAAAVPKRTLTRPLPRKKKRKSDELEASSDVAQDDPSIIPTDMDGEVGNLSGRLKAFKRFKQQNQLQAGTEGVSSENDADETSSLTSLSKGPSSDAQDVDEREKAPTGLRVKRGRPGNAMQVVYSSEPEENQMEMDVVANKEFDKEPVPLRPTLSSIVPDSQPGHLYKESFVEGFRLPFGFAQQPILSPRTTTLEQPTVLQDVRVTDKSRSDSNVPRPLPVEAAVELDVDMETEPTQPLAASEEQRTETASRALGPDESRTFPFPPEMLQNLKAPVLRHHSSISMSSLRHSEPSQPEFVIPKYISPPRAAIAVTNKGLPPLTDQDLESLPILQPIRRSTKALPAKLDERDVFQEEPSTQQSESLDFNDEMRRIFAIRQKQPVELQHHNATEDAESNAHAGFAPQRSADVDLPVQVTSGALSESSSSKARDLAINDRDITERTDAAGAVIQNGVEPDEASAPYAEPEPETMLPLSLDTQLYRPGILSPNFQLRRRPPHAEPEAETMLPLTLDTQLYRPGILSPNFQLQRRPAVIANGSPSPKKNQTIQTPRKQQRFASPVVTPGRLGQKAPTPRSAFKARTPQAQALAHAGHPSPESMIENVETLATWSPAKPAPAYSYGAMQDQNLLVGEEKENVPFSFGGGSAGEGVVPDSPDEVIEGTYGYIESMHLLETYHRGYTPKKDSAVERQEKALPRMTMRPSRPAATKTVFAEVDEAWKGVNEEDKTPKPNNSTRSKQKKDDSSEQSKLASYGFLKNENVRKLRPVGFERDFEAEDDLDPDEEDVEPRNFDRRSLSPTPRKAQSAKALGTVPVPPLDPRLKPAGIKELQRRQKPQDKSAGQGSNDEVKGGVAVKRKEWIEDEAVPSSQPSENQADMFNSDSSTDVALQARLDQINAPIVIEI